MARKILLALSIFLAAVALYCFGISFFLIDFPATVFWEWIFPLSSLFALIAFNALAAYLIRGIKPQPFPKALIRAALLTIAAGILLTALIFANASRFPAR